MSAMMHRTTLISAAVLAVLICAGLPVSLPMLAADGPQSAELALTVNPLASGYGLSLAVAEDGSVWQWGGDLDDPNLPPRPAQVSGLSGVVAVAAGHGYSLALKSDGTVWQWKVRASPYSEVTTPAPVSGLADIVAIAAGSSFQWLNWGNESVAPRRSLALRRDGSVWVWTDVEPPRQMPGLTGIIAIAAGYDHHLALRNDGTVWGWGSNTCGQAGRDPGVVRGRATDWSEAVQVAGISDAVAISAGGSYHFFSFGHSLALKADGSVWLWGCNDGLAVMQSAAKQVSGLPEAAAVAAGGEHSLVVNKDDGTIWGWGWNFYGVLGDGTTSGCQEIVTTPVQASGLAGVVALSAGGYHNLAMTSDGTVWSWGDNCCGLLGDGTMVPRLTPVKVSGLPLVLMPKPRPVVSATPLLREIQRIPTFPRRAQSR